jgi:hypothetical protein
MFGCTLHNYTRDTDTCLYGLCSINGKEVRVRQLAGVAGRCAVCAGRGAHAADTRREQATAA